jgi:hypothetical protein
MPKWLIRPVLADVVEIARWKRRGESEAGACLSKPLEVIASDRNAAILSKAATSVQADSARWTPAGRGAQVQ